MYDFLQVLTKLILTISLLLVSLGALRQIWTADLDLARLVSPWRWYDSAVDEQTSWIPQREADAIYKDGQVVARVFGAVGNPVGELVFQEWYDIAGGVPGLHAILSGESTLEYQRWEIRVTKSGQVVSLGLSHPRRSPYVQTVVAKIIRDRPAL